MNYTKWLILREENNSPTCYVIYEQSNKIIKYSKIGISLHKVEKGIDKFVKWIKK